MEGQVDVDGKAYARAKKHQKRKVEAPSRTLRNVGPRGRFEGLLLLWSEVGVLLE